MPPKPKRERPSLNLDQFFTPTSDSNDLDFLLGAPEEIAQRAEVRGLPLLDLPVRAIAPDAGQVRRLPHPRDLLQRAATGDKATIALLESLRALGESLRAHGQLQPAIVYRDSDPQDAAITHRLLHGQRRWTAATLVDLPTLWVVEIARPSDVNRLLRQVEENERRAGLVDMERAWALISLREAMGRELGQDVPWSVVEAQLQLSEGRRHDLLRLLRFPPPAQEIIVQYGWAEWTLRPLHQAISAGTIDADTATDMLRVLADQPEISAPVVEALVNAYLQGPQDRSQDTAETPPVAAQGSEPADAPDAISQRIVQLRRNVTRLQGQLARAKGQGQRAQWRAEAVQLQESVAALLAMLTSEEP
jgi:ParB/RepB/Spo0J family partition protein